MTVAAVAFTVGCIRVVRRPGGTAFSIGIPKYLILIALVVALVVIFKRRG
ncbi:MAG: hypothetical protein ACYTAN_03305 [Planctomycetota bacterium]